MGIYHQIEYITSTDYIQRRKSPECSKRFSLIWCRQLYDVQEDCILFMGFILFRGVICCSGLLYAVKEGYIDVHEDCILFMGCICCSGGLYAVQEGYVNVQEDYMLKKIIMFLVAIFEWEATFIAYLRQLVSIQSTLD